MNELVYVLAVEALVFGALCTLLLAQRVDVFHWPAERTWPVLSSTLQGLLLYAHALVLLCCFVAAGRFVSFAADVRDACARSAGRITSATVLGAAYVAGLLAARGAGGTDNASDNASADCVACQLLGTSCAQPEPLFLSPSYAVLLAVLLPAAALQAGLLVAAAGMCKEPRVVARRIATANCAMLLALQVQNALQRNAPRLPARCLTAGAAAPANDSSTPVLVTFFVLYVLDAVAELGAGSVLGQASDARREAARNAKDGVDPLEDPPAIPTAAWPALFTSCRVAALVAPWSIWAIFQDDFLPSAVLLAHSAVALVLASLDLGDVWLEHFATVRARRKHLEQLLLLQQGQTEQRVDVARVVGMPRTMGSVAAADLRVPPTRSTRAAFELEPARRRRFVLACNGRARWPAQASDKKTM